MIGVGLRLVFNGGREAVTRLVVVAVAVRNSYLGHYLTSLLGPPAVVTGDVMAWRT